MPDAASERSVQAVSSVATGLASRKLLTSRGTAMAALVIGPLSAATALAWIRAV